MSLPPLVNLELYRGDDAEPIVLRVRGNAWDLTAAALAMSAQPEQGRGEPLHLSTGDFDLLWELASHAGEILSRDHLLRKLRGIDYDGLDRSMDVAISRLRRKLADDPEDPRKIKTIRHKGYLFASDIWWQE